MPTCGANARADQPDGKYGWLAASDVNTTQWTELSPKSPDYLFVPRDEALLRGVQNRLETAQTFSLSIRTGIVSKRDKIAFQLTQENLNSVLNDFHTLDDAYP